jgi:hypothetical protein
VDLRSVYRYRPDRPASVYPATPSDDRLLTDPTYTPTLAWSVAHEVGTALTLLDASQTLNLHYKAICPTQFPFNSLFTDPYEPAPRVRQIT